MQTETTRETTEAEERLFRELVRAYRGRCGAMTQAEVTALAFSALLTLAERDGPLAAAAWARHQAERFELMADVAGSA